MRITSESAKRALRLPVAVRGRPRGHRVLDDLVCTVACISSETRNPYKNVRETENELAVRVTYIHIPSQHNNLFIVH